LETGKVIENTFTAGVKINQIRVERRPYQYLYKDDLGYHFMHQETYEQISLMPDLVENADLMKEGQYVEMMVHAEEERILTCELPPFVEMEVTYTEPGLKGDTASSTALKAATVETGATINVPLFINTGDRIRVDTRTREYYERVK
jgi:elongation factor P